MPPFSFSTADELACSINAYFHYIEGEFRFEGKFGKDTKGDNATQKMWGREPEPPTIAGLAFFLGFNSRQEFDEYRQKGQFAPVLKRGCLRIEAMYERKLHRQSPTGAIFVLKSIGWNERSESQTISAEIPTTLKIDICETGPPIADNERSVIL